MNPQERAVGVSEPRKVEIFYHTRDAAEFHSNLYAQVSAFPGQESVTNLVKLGLYEKAAVVEVPDGLEATAALEVAYAKTQNIDDDWTKNEGVTAVTEFPRSSMTGDVFVIDGKPFTVAMFGFTALDSFAPAADVQKKAVRQRLEREDDGPSF